MTEDRPIPAGGWPCFHCGEVFTTVETAREHFGYELYQEPGCVLKLLPGERGTLARLRAAEDDVARLTAANEQMDHEVGCYHSMTAELGRLFKGAGTVHQAWLELEAMEGRALSAEARLAAYRPDTDPRDGEGGDVLWDAERVLEGGHWPQVLHIARRQLGAPGFDDSPLVRRLSAAVVILQDRIDGLLHANNREVERRRAADQDAARWRALMSSQRMHFMGSSGFDFHGMREAAGRRYFTAESTAKPRDGSHLHFGMEFWDVHEAHGDPEFPDHFERSLLTAYVDALIARGLA
ncbi:MAG: hypothetical protein K9G48_12670 [Reyranella sp.]|nr:hypothetical protein [Reyranella sp.]